MSNQFDEKFYSVEIMNGIYLISSAQTGPTDDPKSLAPGKPTTNSYLVIGDEKAILFDLAVNEPGISDYLKTITKKPVDLVLSHGHPDHIYHVNDFDDLWMHPADEYMLTLGLDILGLPPVNPCPNINYLKNGDIIKLGGRNLEVIHVPGHSPGSILLLDYNTRTLLAGDTCARRLLYGLTEYEPIESFCESLAKIKSLEFDVIYTAHDRCALHKNHIDVTINQLRNKLPKAENFVDIPELGKVVILNYGDERTLQYFDMSFPYKYMSKLK